MGKSYGASSLVVSAFLFTLVNFIVHVGLLLSGVGVRMGGWMCFVNACVVSIGRLSTGYGTMMQNQLMATERVSLRSTRRMKP